MQCYWVIPFRIAPLVAFGSNWFGNLVIPVPVTLVRGIKRKGVRLTSGFESLESTLLQAGVAQW